MRAVARFLDSCYFGGDRAYTRRISVDARVGRAGRGGRAGGRVCRARARSAASTIRKVPLLGVMGAFVFAAQMINFPVGVGTSGHLVGGALLACTLGTGGGERGDDRDSRDSGAGVSGRRRAGAGRQRDQHGGGGVLAGYLPYHFWGGGRGRRAAIFAGGALSRAGQRGAGAGGVTASRACACPQRCWAFRSGLFVVSALLEGAITMAVMRRSERIQPVSCGSPPAGRSP